MGGAGVGIEKGIGGWWEEVGDLVEVEVMKEGKGDELVL